MVLNKDTTFSLCIPRVAEAPLLSRELLLLIFGRPEASPEQRDGDRVSTEAALKGSCRELRSRVQKSPKHWKLGTSAVAPVS